MIGYKPSVGDNGINVIYHTKQVQKPVLIVQE